MTSESRKWESLKAEYLRKVEKALSSVKHPRRKEVLEDVGSHLDRRFAELEWQEQTWENFQRIITEMGPACDYAELLDAQPSSARPAIGLKHLWWLALAGVLVVAAVLLPRAAPAEIAGYIVQFEPVGPFKPVTARQLLEAFNQNHPRGVRTHHFRTQAKGDKLIGYICVDTEGGKDVVASMLEKSEKLKLMKATAATDAELQELYKMGQPSIEPAARDWFGTLPESENRKLLDEQTLKQLRSHEEFSAGWFKVEQEYKTASDGEQDKMVRQWMKDATSDDVEKMTRAIAALGNVAAGEGLDLLMSIGQKPKQGNRPRWMAVRALGRIGDKRAVPLLINLLGHYNSDTRLYARVALCEITGVYFGDSIQKWTEWAQANGIEVSPMDVGRKHVPGYRNRVNRNRRPTTRDREATSRNKTVSRTGEWPGGTCSIRGGIYRKARRGRIGHGKVCLSSGEFGSWVIEVEDHGSFDFSYVPAGVYTLHTLEVFGYKDKYFNPEGRDFERPTFQLKEGERRLASIEIKPDRPYRRISGRVVGEDGEPITDREGLGVCAWVLKPQGRRKGHYRWISSSRIGEDGTYMLEELDGRPVYVQVRDYGAPDKDNPYPPRFYPGTFSRADAKQVTFGDDEMVENIDIPMARAGGLTLAGLVTDKSTGRPVGKALVSLFHFDMWFDLFYGYTDEQGHYEIGGLGEGRFIVHVDAVHKGLVKTRKTVTIDSEIQKTKLDFALSRGVTVSGKFVDEDGNPWSVGRSSGSARSGGAGFGGAASNFRYGNRYAPQYIREGSTVFYEEGEGDGLGVVMVFPTENTFLLPAVVPGETIIEFRPRTGRERLSKILYKGEDISRSGLVTAAGQKIDDVTVVIKAPAQR